MSNLDSLHLKIILAALLHDLGKAFQRAYAGYAKNVESKLFSDFREYEKNNAHLYLPQRKEGFGYTHKHALFTAYILEKHLLNYIPQEFQASCSDADSLVNLACMHHNPRSPEQLIISEADQLSSGFERRELEEQEEKPSSESPRNFFASTIFEDISLTGTWEKKSDLEAKIYYDLCKLSPEAIFPRGLPEIVEKNQKIEEVAKRKYLILISDFLEAFSKLYHKESPELWLSHLVSLLMEYFSLIPSATKARTSKGDFTDLWSDISLFDHLYFTASLASALYMYHTKTNTLNENEIKNKEQEKFLLLEGNFYGIQKFIFSEGGSTRRYAAKILRGRSFMVSLMSELCADYILRSLGLNQVSTLFNTAGKFLLLLPNLPEIRDKLPALETEINKWLYERFYGETSIGITWIPFAPRALLSPQGYESLISSLGQKAEEKKFQKFDLYEFGGFPEDYFEHFSGYSICDLCMRRPASEEVFFEEESKIRICSICADQKRLGESLVKKPFLAIYNSQVKQTTLKERYFYSYKISFLDEKELSQLKTDGLLYLWDIRLPLDAGKQDENFYLAKKFLNAFVPREEKGVLSFEDLARKSLEDTPNGKVGAVALGVVKADLDNLGYIFAKGFRESKRTFSRYLTLSRFLNLFFAYFLPYYCAKKHKYIYNVFAGGDDLFVVGPWRQTITFIREVRKLFREYTAFNPSFTISAGYLLTKPIIPVSEIAERVEGKLHKAKNNKDEASGRTKDSLHIFGEAVFWEELDTLLGELYEKLKSWLSEELFTKVFLFKLNELTEMRRLEREMMKEGRIKLDDLRALLWRSKLYYFGVRNIRLKLPKEEQERKLQEILATLTEALNKYGGAFRVPLWHILYETRRVSDE